MVVERLLLGGKSFDVSHFRQAPPLRKTTLRMFISLNAKDKINTVTVLFFNAGPVQ